MIEKNVLAKGYFFSITSSVLLTIMALTTSQTGGAIAKEQLIFMRGVWGIAFILPYLLYKRESFTITPAILARCFFGSVSIALYFTSLQLGYATEARTLSNFNTIFVFLISIFYFKESVSVNKVIGFFLVLLGLTALSMLKITNGNLEIVILGLAGGFFAALAFTSLKKATQKSSAELIVFYLSFFLMLLSSIAGGKKVIDFSNVEITPLLVISLSGVLAQIALTKSYLYLSSTEASKLSNLVMILIFFSEILFFGKEFSVSIILSYGLVLMGVYVSFVKRDLLQNVLLFFQKN